MNNAKITSMTLTSVRYIFTSLNKKSITVSIDDQVEVKEIAEEQATLRISRELKFGDHEECTIAVEYEATLESSENLSKEMVVDHIKSDNFGITTVYSKISLLISELTNASPFGVIVTPPMRNKENFTVI